MTMLKYDDVINKLRDLDYCFGIFEISDVVPHSCKVS